MVRYSETECIRAFRVASIACPRPFLQPVGSLTLSYNLKIHVLSRVLEIRWASPAGCSWSAAVGETADGNLSPSPPILFCCIACSQYSCCGVRNSTYSFPSCAELWRPHTRSPLPCLGEERGAPRAFEDLST
jgi:hypothetical protein